MLLSKKPLTLKQTKIYYLTIYCRLSIYQMKSFYQNNKDDHEKGVDALGGVIAWRPGRHLVDLDQLKENGKFTIKCREIHEIN